MGNLEHYVELETGDSKAARVFKVALNPLDSGMLYAHTPLTALGKFLLFLLVSFFFFKSFIRSFSPVSQQMKKQPEWICMVCWLVKPSL